MIYRKTYMDQIIPFIDTPFVKILTGVRRCGKSTIMEMIKGELVNRGIPPESIISYRFTAWNMRTSIQPESCIGK